jgi:predicted transcriptional regulator
MEIYNDILNSVANELTDDQAKPTRVQFYSNLSYDKLVRYLTELEDKNLIIKDPLTITEKGREFLQYYDRIANFVLKMGIKYFGSENSVKGDEK